MTTEERKAQNELLFREQNALLAEGARRIVSGEDSLVPFLCECPRVECTAVVLLSLEEYAEIRSRPRHGFNVAGHEDPQIEHVVATNERFTTTSKHASAGEFVEQEEATS